MPKLEAPYMYKKIGILLSFWTEAVTVSGKLMMLNKGLRHIYKEHALL